MKNQTGVTASVVKPYVKDSLRPNLFGAYYLLHAAKKE